MTGQYPQRWQLTDWLPGRADRPDQKLKRPTLRQQLPLEAVTLAEALKPAGYVCASIGKWHLGGEGFDPTKQGFDINIAGDAAGSPQSYFAPFARPNGKAMPGLQEAPAGEYLTDRLTAEAEKFVEQHRERPFFLYLPHFGVHSPFHESFGYYADPVDESSATLPKGWKSRLVSLPPGETDGVQGLCLEPHDLAIAKYVARREKDLAFTSELARRAIVARDRLLALVDRTPVSEEVRERMRQDIARDFA